MRRLPLLCLFCTLSLASAQTYLRWDSLHTNLPLGAGAGVVEVAMGGTPSVIAALVDGQGLYRTADLGRTWTRLTVPGKPTNVAMPADERDTLWVPTEADGLQRSTDGGKTWQKVAGLASDAVEWVTFGSALAPKVVLVGHVGGKLLSVSRDGGATWTTSDLGHEIKRQLPFVLSPTQWVVASRGQDGLATTADAGATWQVATGSVDYFPGPLPAVQAGTTLFSSKHHGFSKSTDGGRTWNYTMEQHTRVLGSAGEIVFRENRREVRGTNDRMLFVEMSTNFGQSWQDVTGSLTALAGAAARPVLVISNDIDPFAHVRIGTAWASSADGSTVLLALGKAGLYRGRLLLTRGGPMVLAGSVAPFSVTEGEDGTSLTFKAVATARLGRVAKVTADLGALGGPSDLPLFDDGKHDDGEAGDKSYAATWLLDHGLPAGPATVGLVAEDDQGRFGSRALQLDVAGRQDRMTVWDGEQYAHGLPWTAPVQPLNFFNAQTDDAHSGKVALELHGEGSGYIGGGWNWFGWWPQDAGNDIRGFRNLSFWAKVVAEKPTDFTVGLNNSTNKEPTALVSALEYCPELRDGQWHEVVIPLADIYAAKETKFDPRRAWELDVNSWEPQGRVFSVLLDDIGFDNRPARAHSLLVRLPISRDAPVLRADAAAVTADVDLSAAGTAVSPYIYGAAQGERELAQEMGLTMLRAGGNPISPFDWRTGYGSQGNDWYFQNTGKPTRPEDTWFARFHGENRKAGLESYLTLPMMGRVAKDGTSVAFDTDKYPDQESWAGKAQPTDRLPKAGNGRQYVRGADGKLVLDAQGKSVLRDIAANPDDTSVAVTPAEQTAALKLMVEGMGYGTAAKGGIKVVALDNEPALWQSTHRGMRTTPLSYDELLERTLTYGGLLKRIDPTVKLAGPAAWGWTEYLLSGLDAAMVQQGKATWEAPPDYVAHGKQWLTKWYLTKLHEHEQKTGQKLLDILDWHFYPQTGIYQAGTPGDAKTMEERVQETRVLWDPTWKEPSWMGKEVDHVIRLLPLMKEWIAECYPGLQTSIGEYSFGGDQDVSGGVAQAEVLGIFAREGIDYAFYWFFPSANSPAYYAYKLYRNPDGKHTAVGDHYLPAKVSAPTDVSVHVLRDAVSGRVSLILVNKRAAKDTKVTLNFAKPLPAQQVAEYEYSAVDRFSLGKRPTRQVSGTHVDVALSAMSVLRLDIKP